MQAKVKTTLLILIILLSALLWAVGPQSSPVAMRRESRIQPATLEEALNISLAIGDYRRVDFSKVM